MLNQPPVQGRQRQIAIELLLESGQVVFLASILLSTDHASRTLNGPALSSLRSFLESTEKEVKPVKVVPRCPAAPAGLWCGGGWVPVHQALPVGTAPCLSAEHLQVLALVVLLGVFSGEEVDRNKHVNTMSVGDQWSAELGLEARECQRGWSGQAL